MCCMCYLYLFYVVLLCAAESLGLPFIPPYVGGDGNAVDFGQGMNYAVASATALEVSFHEARGYSVPTNASLRVQLEWFKQSLSSMCATLSGKQLSIYQHPSIVMRDFFCHEF